MLGKWGRISDIREYLLLQTCGDDLLCCRLHDIIYYILEELRIGTLKRILQLQHDPELCDRPSINEIWDQAVHIFITECDVSDHTAEIFAALELDTRPMDAENFTYLLDDGIDSANGPLIEHFLNSKANRSEMALSVACDLDNAGVSEWMIPIFKRLDPDILAMIAEEFHGTDPEVTSTEEVINDPNSSGCTVLAGLSRDTVSQ